MSRFTGGNEDWIKRGSGRIPTKGALAAERASAGLGTSDDDDGSVFAGPSRPQSLWVKPASKPPQRPKESKL
jgi:hypothetical protein